MPANLENSAVATGLEKVNCHSNSKERQCKRMLKLPYNCANFKGQQGNAQTPSGWASTAHESRTSRCTSWIYKGQRKQRSNCQHLLDHRKKQDNSRKTYTPASLTMLKPLTMRITTNLKILEQMGKYHFTCLLRTLQADQEETVRTGH